MIEVVDVQCRYRKQVIQELQRFQTGSNGEASGSVVTYNKAGMGIMQLAFQIIESDLVYSIRQFERQFGTIATSLPSA